MLADFKFYLAFILIFANFAVFGAVLKGLRNTEPVFYFLPVGQGDASLLTTKRNVVLIDAGPSPKIVNLLDAAIPIYRRKIDLLFISHPNIDHFGGVFELARRYRIRALFLNGAQTEQGSFKNLLELVKENNIIVIYARRGQEIEFSAKDGDNLRFEILWPDNNLKIGSFIKDKQLNDTSVVNLVSFRDFQALFTGDISAKVEKLLLASLPDIELLKVPHHGSKYSSSFEFLQRVSPEFSVISVGKNSYGHPTKETLSRLESVGSQIFRTDVDGLVKLYFEDNRLLVKTRN
jgi:competence protein ComEC